MAHADFVHLRARSAYSLSEGAIKTAALVDLCRDQSMPAVAITDNGNLFGALEFAGQAAAQGVQPIIGCLLGITGRVETAVRRPPPDPILLLAKDEAGYANLLHLVSRSFLEGEAGEAPQLTLDAVAERAAGLIALTGGPQGPVGRLLQEGQTEAAEKLIRRLAEIFPDRLYVEIMRHGLDAEKQTEPAFLEFADRFDLPLVATNDIYFADAAMYEAHDALLCIADGALIDQPDRRRLTREHRFKSPDEMRALFADLPEAYDNALTVARRCAVFPESRAPLLPRFAADGDEPGLLRRQAEEGLNARLAALSLSDDPEAAKPYRERLDYELRVIAEMGYAGYFLIVADFIGWAKENAIPVGPGRGSGAGSVAAWALGITDLNPLRFGLLFERFLNPERVSMPDFDIDFCVERRDEVIHYVQEKYGRDRVAQIITFGTLQARAALRDVGRVMSLPYGQVDRVCKLVPFNPANPPTLAQAIAAEPALQQARDDEPEVAGMMDLALQLEGLTRHASTHAAGVVIGDRPLSELTPLYRDPRSDMPVTQFSMKYVEKAGLVKFDFLGLKTLTLLDKAAALVCARDPAFDLTAAPLDDAATYAMLAAGDTVGVFQLESAGMRDVLRQLKPDRFEEIIAVVALYRPGPMDNIPSFIARKHGREKADGLDPRVESVLSETYGIMIYQEQVMRIAQVLAGYSLGGADLLRRAMGKKIQSEMDAQRQAFVDGAEQRGMPRPKAEAVFDQVAKFAGYGFNKSHAAAYALVAYHTAYMKANYPVEFLAASMTCDLHNTDKLAAFRREARRLGIGVLPPDVNRSRAEFTVEPLAPGDFLPGDSPPEDSDAAESTHTHAVRYGLAGIRNVGEQAMRDLVAGREGDGPFRSPGDFASRLDTKTVNKRLLESLVCAGGFDCLEADRARVFAGIEEMTRLSAAQARDRDSGQENLFAAPVTGSQPSAPEIRPGPFTPWNASERLKREYDALGFYLSAHPLDAYAAHAEKSGALSAARLEDHVRKRGGETKIKLAGVVLSKRERTSQKGNRYAFVELSDSSGMFEVVVFSEALAEAGPALEPGGVVWLEARARIDGDSLRIAADKAAALDSALAGTGGGARIHWGGLTPDNHAPDDPVPDSAAPGFSEAAAANGKGKVNGNGRSNGHGRAGPSGGDGLASLKAALAPHAVANGNGQSGGNGQGNGRSNGDNGAGNSEGNNGNGQQGGPVVIALRACLNGGPPVAVEIALPGRYRASPALVADLADLPGVDKVELR